MRYVFKYFELNQFITTTATYNNLFFPSLHSIMLKLFKNSLIIFFVFWSEKYELSDSTLCVWIQKISNKH